MARKTRLRLGDKLVLATHNDGKLREFRELFKPIGLELVSAGELGLPEPDETGKTFVDNAILKAQAAANGANLIALADDSGLCVDALGGDPGIYTARWAGPDRDFNLAMKRVEDALQAANATMPAQRAGQFMATLCLATPEGDTEIFEGQAEGTLVWPLRGKLGFGFDPMFMPKGHDITFGEMPSHLKHSWSPTHTGLSHRAKAFAKFVETCCDY